MLAWQLPAGTVNCIQFTILFSLKASPPNHKGHTIIECAPLSSLPHRVCVGVKGRIGWNIMTVTHSIIHAIVQQQKVAKGAKEVYNGIPLSTHHCDKIATQCWTLQWGFSNIYIHPSMEKESQVVLANAQQPMVCRVPFRSVIYLLHRKRGVHLKGPVKNDGKKVNKMGESRQCYPTSKTG